MRLNGWLLLALGGVSMNLSAANNLVVAYDSDPVSLDPQEQLSVSMFQMSHMVFDSLVRYDQDLSFEPRLAERWERVDDKTVRFYLRKNVQFHSGNHFTAKDVVWTFDRLKTSVDHKAVLAPFKGMELVDDYTVDLVAHHPYPLYLQAAAYIFPMDSAFYSGVDDNNQPKAKIVKNGQSYASLNASGTGPYTVSYREQGIKTTYSRFSGYWDQGGNIDQVTVVPIKNSATRTAALLSGDVDMIAPVVPTDFKRIEASQQANLLTKEGIRLITLQMNQTNPVLANPKVRQAIVYAINNQAIAKKIMRGFAIPASQQWPQTYAGHNPKLDLRYDPEKSKALLKEAGFGEGLSLTMIAPNNRYVNDAKVAQAVSSMLAKVGIKVDLRTMPKAQYWPEFATCATDILMIGWGAETENFSDFLVKTRNKETGQGQYNCGHYSNPVIDRLIDQSHTELDEQKRALVLQEIEQRLYEDAAFVPLHWQNIAWAVKPGINIAPIVNAMNLHYFGNLYVEENNKL
ncbi:ABC transporter substrate-binding protein [Photobacterium sanctipauli]|uniref:ABC transporter substrate-binding protein n=1 Tax=Photobacterium sanctipauli TaxID=1342794 RepID=A0A2T3NX20_9GAMM|nr:ABC transporter substrate-binding protein [Photobacterium sanctipauli]PSW20806.1 ABC transporter substrate-binding protein [Photobacterium sanctipauli]